MSLKTETILLPHNWTSRGDPYLPDFTEGGKDSHLGKEPGVVLFPEFVAENISFCKEP